MDINPSLRQQLGQENQSKVDIGISFNAGWDIGYIKHDNNDNNVSEKNYAIKSAVSYSSIRENYDRDYIERVYDGELCENQYNDTGAATKLAPMVTKRQNSYPLPNDDVKNLVLDTTRWTCRTVYFNEDPSLVIKSGNAGWVHPMILNATQGFQEEYYCLNCNDNCYGCTQCNGCYNVTVSGDPCSNSCTSNCTTGCTTACTSGCVDVVGGCSVQVVVYEGDICEDGCTSGIAHCLTETECMDLTSYYNDPCKSSCQGGCAESCQTCTAQVMTKCGNEFVEEMEEDCGGCNNCTNCTKCNGGVSEQQKHYNCSNCTEGCTGEGTTVVNLCPQCVNSCTESCQNYLGGLATKGQDDCGTINFGAGTILKGDDGEGQCNQGVSCSQKVSCTLFTNGRVRCTGTVNCINGNSLCNNTQTGCLPGVGLDSDVPMNRCNQGVSCKQQVTCILDTSSISCGGGVSCRNGNDLCNNTQTDCLPNVGETKTECFGNCYSCDGLCNTQFFTHIAIAGKDEVDKQYCDDCDSSCDNNCQGCTSGCTTSCTTGCTSCISSCTTSCTSGCTTGCTSGCTGSCTGCDSCTGSCTTACTGCDGCTSGCTTNCTSCAASCTSPCTGCIVSCTGGDTCCTSYCTTGCASGCEGGCQHICFFNP